jgi:hypothetical protein
VQGDGMARRGYPPEFRRRVLELVEVRFSNSMIEAFWRFLQRSVEIMQYPGQKRGGSSLW